MEAEILRQNWALVAGIFVLTLAGIAFFHALMKRSSGGLLRRDLKQLREARRRRTTAEKAVAAAAKRLADLSVRADSTKPRLIEQARATLGDAEALHKIAGDQVMVAATKLRHTIVDEFPPAKQAALRDLYLGEDDNT